MADTNLDHGPPAINHSEDAIAEAFSDRFADELRYVPGWRRWLVWDGRRWAPDETLTTQHLVRLACRSSVNVAFDELGTRELSRLASAATMSAVERLARSDRRHVVSPDQLDAIPMALNTPAGTVNLRTGRVEAHQRADLHTKVTAAAPGGACDRWLKFLGEVTGGDVEFVGYLQRWAGYCLTGETSEHAFGFLVGDGGNGKSLFVNTLAAALGDYAAVAMPDLFLASRSEQHPTGIASLRGARLVIAAETEDGRPWAEARVKQLTGGDPISARVMRGDPLTFTPRFKVLITGNHKPPLRNPQAAMRRRLHIVPFTHSPCRPNPHLPEQLRHELPGILAWAVHGCLEWQKRGLAMPAIVERATTQYFDEQDLVAIWLRERCDLRVPDARSSPAALFSDWRTWARSRGEDPGSLRRFSDALASRGFARERSNGARFFRGVVPAPIREDEMPQ